MASIAVTGASGQLGDLILKYLHQLNATIPLVALARTPSKINLSFVEARAFDYVKVSAATLQGVSILILVSSSEFIDRFSHHKAVIDAALQANVKTLIYTSLLRADTSALQLADDHRSTEEYLKSIPQNKLKTIVLRNGWYFENWNLKVALQTGGLLGATHGAKLSPALRSEYAEATARIALSVHEQHPVKSAYELAGTFSFTLPELTEALSKHTGKKVAYIDLSEKEYEGKLESFGLPKVLAGLLAQADEAASKGELWSDNKDLETILGRKTANLEEAIKLTVG